MSDHVTIHLDDGTTLHAVDSGELVDDQPDDQRTAEEALDAAGHPLPEHLKGGRPSLHGGRGRSPQVAFRIPEEVRTRAAAEAARRGITVSRLAREALERELA